MDGKTLLRLAKTEGTPIVVVDHKTLRENYGKFCKHMPRVQVYYAVKANSAPGSCGRSTKREGASMSPASPIHDHHENVKDLPNEQRQAFIWIDLYANPIKATETPRNPISALVTATTTKSVQDRVNMPHAGHATPAGGEYGPMVELSSKFGAPPNEAVDPVVRAQQQARSRGPSFHVGSQYERAELRPGASDLRGHLRGSQDARHRSQASTSGAASPPTTTRPCPFKNVAQASTRLKRLFPPPIEILAEPGRFLVASAATAVAKIIGKAVREGKLCYYINDGVYQTYSGVIFDHCQYSLKAFKNGPTQLCSVFGPTCDALDTISLAEQLPDMELGDFVYAPNIGAYSAASSTFFNGFPPARVIHLNQ